MTRSTLVVRADSMGDVLLAGPAIRAVATTASVTLLCSPLGEPAAALLPGVRDVMVESLPWILAEPPRATGRFARRLIARLRRRRFDEAIVLTSHHQSALPAALVLRAAGVPRVGAISDDYPGSLLDVRHRVAHDVHEVERNLSLVAAMGYALDPVDDDRLRVRTGASPLSVASESFVVVHPGASVPARTWPAERFAALVDRLAARRTVVVTGSPSERALTATVAGRGPHRVDLGGVTTLAVTAEVLRRAACVVVGNTGPAHLAAAVGTPVVSLYAPTVPAVRWRPWRVRHELLGNQSVPCAGCRARGCPTDHRCLLDVTVEDVAAAVERLVGADARRGVAS